MSQTLSNKISSDKIFDTKLKIRQCCSTNYLIRYTALLSLFSLISFYTSENHICHHITGCGLTGGKVELADNQQPMICYENRMVPICGRSFWKNDFGAQIFCKMLNKTRLVLRWTKAILLEDAFVVGQCLEGDEELTSCTGRCNLQTLGGRCDRWKKDETCYKGSKSGLSIRCFSKTLFHNLLAQLQRREMSSSGAVY